MYLVKIFSKKKKIEFIIADFQTQFIDNKETCEKKPSGKPISLEKVVPFTRNRSFKWKSFRLFEVVPFSGS